jgi:hypothetical protein
MSKRVIASWVFILAAIPRFSLAEVTYPAWLLGMIKDMKTETQLNAERVKVAVSTRSNTNQSEAPSMSSNTSSLVDTSSASDLIGVALNLAGLTAGTQSSKNSNDATSSTATVSGYVLYTALQGEDPLAPGRYCTEWAQWARSVSVTLGFDDQSGGTGSNGTSQSPIVAGAKFSAPWLNWRNVCAPGAFDKVTQALVPAAATFGSLSEKVQDRFYDTYPSVKSRLPPDVSAMADEKLASAASKAASASKGKDPSLQLAAKERARRIEFLNLLGDPVFFPAFLAVLGDNAKQIAKESLGPEGVDPFVHLDDVAQQKIEEFQKAPQISFSFLTKQRSDGDDDYQSQAIVDVGLARRLNLTANGSYEGKTKRLGSDENGGRVAAQLQFQPLPDNLSGPKPLRLSLGFDGAWMTSERPTYKGQIKINLPIPRIQALSGLEIPLSVTIANRSDLVNETEVRGLIGFTVDTSQVLAALQQRP